MKGKEEKTWLKYPFMDSYCESSWTLITHGQVSLKIYQTIIFARHMSHAICQPRNKMYIFTIIIYYYFTHHSKELYGLQLKAIL